jgi:hypothetical protein
MRVAVLAGGRSSEHEVSLHSAAFVREAVAAAGHEVVPVTVERGGAWVHDGEALALTPGGGLLGADAVFPVLHGPFGEDGTVQGLLEIADVPYVGAGVLASALCMDKVTFKDLMSRAGVPQVGYVGLREGDDRSALHELGEPLPGRRVEPLGQAEDRRRPGQATRDLAERVTRDCDNVEIGSGQRRVVERGGGDAVEVGVGQVAGVAAGLLDLARLLWVASRQDDVVAAAGEDAGERRAPRAGAGDNCFQLRLTKSIATGTPFSSNR